MNAANRAVGSSAGGNTRSTVAASAGSNANPAMLRSRPWNRGRHGWLSQVSAAGRVPAVREALMVTAPGCLVAASRQVIDTRHDAPATVRGCDAGVRSLLEASLRRMWILPHHLQQQRMRRELRCAPLAGLTPAEGAVERACCVIVGQH